MGFSATLLALTAVSAVSQISQGYAQKKEAGYNADLVEQEAANIDIKKNIDFGKFQRLKGQVLSTSVSNVGGSGIGLQGSAMAVMVEAQTQINIDQAIGQYNFEQDKNYKLNQSDSIRRKGSQAVRTGYTNAFSTALRGASSYATYTGGFDNPLRLKDIGGGTPSGIENYVSGR